MKPELVLALDVPVNDIAGVLPHELVFATQ
jgi:hypothetical protein